MPTFVPDSGGSSAGGSSAAAPPRGGTFVPAGHPAETRAGASRDPLRAAPGYLQQLGKSAKLHDGPGPAWTPVQAALDIASLPAYAVGQAILHPTDKRTWTESGINLFRDKSKHVLPGQALRQRGALNAIPSAYGLRSVASLVGDVALNPLTYVSFGTGASVRAGGNAIGEAASRNIDAIVAEGGMPSMADVAKAAAMSAAERQALPASLKVFLRVPFTRGKEVLLGESEGIPAAVAKVAGQVAGKLPEKLKQTSDLVRIGVGTGRGLDPVVGAVRQATRLRAAYETGVLDRTTQKLNDAILKREQDLGLTPNEGSNAITFHLDNPGKYPVPAGLEDLTAEATALRDSFATVEDAAGVRFRKVEHYIPHMGATPADARKIAELYVRPTANKLDEPFFVHPRLTANLDEFIAAGQRHGFTPELNVAKLLQSRGRASIRAREKKAIDDAIHGQLGAKPPPIAVPEVGPAAVKAADAQARLEHLVQPLPTAGAQRTAAEARQAQVDARAALAAAQRTGDVGAVQAARADLAAANQAGSAEVRSVAAEQAQTSVPEFQRLSRDAGATGAALPTPTAGRYLLPLDRSKLASRLRVVSRRSRQQAKDLRASVAEDLKAEAQARKATYKPGSTGYGRMSGIHTDLRYRQDLSAADQRPYSFNGGNENSGVHYRTAAEGGGRKNLADYERDILNEISNAGDQHGVEVLTPADRRIYDATSKAAELENAAHQIDSAFTDANGGPFGGLDPAVGQERLQQLADSLISRRVINSRARRARNAQKTGPLVDLPGATAAQRARARSIFSPDSSLAGEAAQVRDSAVAEVEKAMRKADVAVARAEKRLAGAQKQGAEPVIREAKAGLARATATSTQARLALERARAGYVGAPREVAAQTKRVLKANRQLTKAEQKAGAVRLANERLAARPERPTTPEEWAALKDEWTSIRTATKYHDGSLLPPKVAEDMKRVHRELTPMFDETELLRMGRVVQRLTGRWKSLALLNPGYHLRNMYDDGMRAYMAGARDPRSFAQAAHILTGRSPSALIKIGPTTWTHAQYLRRARAYGVIDTGYVRSDVQSSAERVTSHRLRGPGRGPAARASAAVGNSRENMTRLGTFIELEKAGLNPWRAAQKTADYLFDYGQVGQLVEAARKTFAPFVTYPSKAIPFTAKELLRRPGRYANLNAAIQALNRAGGNPDLSLLPLGAQSSFAVPVPGFLRTAVGAPQGQPLLANPQNLFSYGSLNMLDPRLSRLRQNYLGGLLNPAVRVPLEIATGKNFYLGSDLPKLTRAPSFMNTLAGLGVPIPTYVGSGSPGAKRDFYTGKPIGGYSSYLDELLRMLPIYGQAGSVMPGGSSSRLPIARLGFGFSLSPFDRAKALARVQKFGKP